MKSLSFMRGSLVVLLFIALSVSSHAIPPEDAAKHEGEAVTVEGKVFEVIVSGKGNAFLNFGGTNPNQEFAAVIFARASNSDFVNLKLYEGKTVTVTGNIQLYRGKPEIIIKDSSLIKVVQ
jgi:DNA/RNA endonuclease YhcR with UshA esterase domain